MCVGYTRSRLVKTRHGLCLALPHSALLLNPNFHFFRARRERVRGSSGGARAQKKKRGGEEGEQRQRPLETTVHRFKAREREGVVDGLEGGWRDEEKEAALSLSLRGRETRRRRMKWASEREGERERRGRKGVRSGFRGLVILRGPTTNTLARCGGRNSLSLSLSAYADVCTCIYVYVRTYVRGERERERAGGWTGRDRAFARSLALVQAAWPGY